VVLGTKRGYAGGRGMLIKKNIHSAMRRTRSKKISHVVGGCGKQLVTKRFCRNRKERGRLWWMREMFEGCGKGGKGG